MTWGSNPSMKELRAKSLPKERIDEKIRSFADLADGWRYGEGVRIDASIIRKALQINSLAYTLGFLETDAFPGTAGEVRVTAYHEQHFLYLEFTVEADGFVTFDYEKGEE